jgi:hypothetical protein
LEIPCNAMANDGAETLKKGKIDLSTAVGE